MTTELSALRASLRRAEAPAAAPSVPGTSHSSWRRISMVAFALGVALGIVLAPRVHSTSRTDSATEDPLFQPFAE